MGGSQIRQCKGRGSRVKYSMANYSHFNPFVFFSSLNLLEIFDWACFCEIFHKNINIWSPAFARPLPRLQSPILSTLTPLLSLFSHATFHDTSQLLHKWLSLPTNSVLNLKKTKNPVWSTFIRYIRKQWQ